MCARAAVLLGPEVWVHGGAARAQGLWQRQAWSQNGAIVAPSGEGAQHLPLQCIHSSNICCLLWRQKLPVFSVEQALGSAQMPLQVPSLWKLWGIYGHCGACWSPQGALHRAGHWRPWWHLTRGWGQPSPFFVSCRLHTYQLSEPHQWLFLCDHSPLFFFLLHHVVIVS